MGDGKARKYDSPLREERAQQTEKRIKEAIADLLSEKGLQNFSMQKVADRAGVSKRTVYRYVPSRDDLVTAVSELYDEQIKPPKWPESTDEIPDAVEGVFPQFDENENLIRAVLNTQFGREFRQRSRLKRHDAFRELLDEELTELDSTHREWVVAVVGTLSSSETWRTMKDEFDLRGDESAKIVSWAIESLIDKAREDFNNPSNED